MVIMHGSLSREWLDSSFKVYIFFAIFTLPYYKHWLPPHSYVYFLYYVPGLMCRGSSPGSEFVIIVSDIKYVQWQRFTLRLSVQTFNNKLLGYTSTSISVHIRTELIVEVILMLFLICNAALVVGWKSLAWSTDYNKYLDCNMLLTVQSVCHEGSIKP